MRSLLPPWITDAWRTGGAAGRLWTGLIAIGLLGWLATVLIAAGERNDMDIFLQASADIIAGKNAYLHTYNEWYRYFYSPLFALVVAPLAVLGPFGAKVLWGVSIIALTIRCLWIVDAWTGLRAWSPVHRARYHALLLLFLFQPVRDNINSMQLTPLLLWIVLEAVRLVRSGRPVAGGALLAFGMDVKLMPIVLIPYLIWRRHWAGAVAAVLFFLAWQMLPATLLGVDQLMELGRTRAALLDPADPRHILDEEEPTFISLGSLLSAYLSTEGGSSHTIGLPRNLADLPVGTIATLLLMGRLLLVALTLWFVRWPPFRGEPDERRVLIEISYLLVCSILLFPHQRNYSMLLAAPTVAWLLANRLSMPPSPTARRWTVALVVVFLGLNTELLIGEFGPVFAHYKLKSLLVLALIGMLMIMPREMRGAPRATGS